ALFLLSWSTIQGARTELRQLRDVGASGRRARYVVLDGWGSGQLAHLEANRQRDDAAQVAASPDDGAREGHHQRLDRRRRSAVAQGKGRTHARDRVGRSAGDSGASQLTPRIGA